MRHSPTRASRRHRAQERLLIIGTGSAALTAAFLPRARRAAPGANIHVFDKDKLPGGALDGAFVAGEGYAMRGGREMDNHWR